MHFSTTDSETILCGGGGGWEKCQIIKKQSENKFMKEVKRKEEACPDTHHVLCLLLGSSGRLGPAVEETRRGLGARACRRATSQVQSFSIGPSVGKSLRQCGARCPSRDIFLIIGV